MVKYNGVNEFQYSKKFLQEIIHFEHLNYNPNETKISTIEHVYGIYYNITPDELLKLCKKDKIPFIEIPERKAKSGNNYYIKDWVNDKMVNKVKKAYLPNYDYLEVEMVYKGAIVSHIEVYTTMEIFLNKCSKIFSRI